MTMITHVKGPRLIDCVAGLADDGATAVETLSVWLDAAAMYRSACRSVCILGLAAIPAAALSNAH
jgi:hypothetical protein